MKSLTVLLLLSFFFPETKAQDSLYLVGTITGESSEKRITNISRVGDVNGDGYNDFMIASRTGLTRKDQGIVQLYLGSSTLDLTLDVTFHYPCCDSLNNLGNASEIGDVNGDGYDDFAISGAFGDWGFVRGKLFIYYGGETIDTIPAVEFYENTVQDYFGSVVEELGDLNKDSYDDFAICSSYNWSDGLGHVYLIFGGDSISWNNRTTFTGIVVDDFFGTSIANIGDNNNDNYEDIAIGAPAGLLGSDSGKVYIFLGGDNIDTDFDFILSSETQGYEFGKSVKKIGNLNGDNKIDYCVMEFESVYIYDNILNQPLILNGYSLDTGGDINNDFYNDIIVGNENNINIYFGNENFSPTPDIIINDSLKYSTQFLCIIGDINNDGYDEITSFAPNWINQENPLGKIFIYSYLNLTDIKESNNTPLYSFILFQNYPNPFNPSTSIQYSINSMQFVTLKVYNVLGKEIATLVNEEKPAGSYEVKFDASKLASGIYYYQLRAGEYVETKKMILLK